GGAGALGRQPIGDDALAHDPHHLHRGGGKLLRHLPARRCLPGPVWGPGRWVRCEARTGGSVTGTLGVLRYAVVSTGLVLLAAVLFTLGFRGEGDSTAIWLSAGFALAVQAGA